MSTTIDRVHFEGKSGAMILAAGLGMKTPETPEEKADWFYRALVRLHKKEKLKLCEEYSIRKGHRPEPRVLP